MIEEKETQSDPSQKISKDDPRAAVLDTRSSKVPTMTPEQARMAVGLFAGIFLFMVIFFGFPKAQKNYILRLFRVK